MAINPKIHKISQEEYRMKYGHVKCKNLRDSLLGIKNPGYRHGGKLSPFSKKFVNYKDDETVTKLTQKSVETRFANNNNHTSVSYFTSRGYSEEESLQMISKRQTTFSLQICIDKYGVEVGTKRWVDRQEKWLSNFKKMNYSKISQILFHNIIKTYSGDIYFATYDRPEMQNNINKEYRLSLLNSHIMPDFICLKTKRIIEFDGDYWHREQVANPTREKDRDERIIEAGYTVLHIKECDFKKNKQQIIQECINFLTQ